MTVPTSINTVSLSQRQGASAQKPDNLIHQLLLAQGIRVNADFWQAVGREHSLLHISTEAAALLLQGRVAHHAGAVQQATKMSSMALQQLRIMLAQHHTPQDPVNIPLLVIIMNMTVFEVSTLITITRSVYMGIEADARNIVDCGDNKGFVETSCSRIGCLD